MILKVYTMICVNVHMIAVFYADFGVSKTPDDIQV